MTGFPTPRQCPDVRLDMIRDLNPGGGHHELIDRMCTPGDPLFNPFYRGVTATTQCKGWQSYLAKCDLFWIRHDIVDLINTNLEAIDGSTTLDPTWVPSEHGLAFIEGGLSSPPGSKPIHAFTWTIANGDLVINVWGYDQPYWISVGGDTWKADVSIDDVTTHLEAPTSPEEQRMSCMFFRRWLTSFFAFLKTPRVVTVDRRPADRHAIKRSQRAGLNLNDTRVIYLRTTNHATGNETGEDRYHHRWIVSGHWRSQPYGPRSERRRPIWIMPHIKGPDGAPLLGGEKVRAVIR